MTYSLWLHCLLEASLLDEDMSTTEVDVAMETINFAFLVWQQLHIRQRLSMVKILM